jgi:hypothetical protein
VHVIIDYVRAYLDRNYPMLGKEGKNMTFLKKLGQFLAKAAAIELGLGPLLQPFLGSAAVTGSAAPVASVVINDLTQVANIATMVEAVIQTPGAGAQKLAAATPLVLQVLRTSQAFAGKKIANEALAEKGASDVVSGIVEFMNAIDPEVIPVKIA